MERLNRDLVLVDAKLPNGAVLKVAAVDRGSAHDVSLLNVFSLDSLQHALSGLAEMAKRSLEDASPDTVEIEFELGLTLEAGKLVSLLAAAGTGASLTVRLGWHRPSNTSAALEQAHAAHAE
jgi:hypothetical protein